MYFKKYIIISRMSILTYQIVQTLMKCLLKQHFICVFTVCQSTHLGVSSPQRVDRVCAVVTTNVVHAFSLGVEGALCVCYVPCKIYF